MKVDRLIEELKYAKKYFGNKDVKIVINNNSKDIDVIRYDKDGIYILT